MTKIKTKKIIGMIVLLGLWPSVSHSQETKSADYQLDFDIIVNEAEYTKSENFQVQGHSTNIETVISSADFQIVPPYLPVCGNLVLENGEECDGTNFNGKTCADYSYGNGSLSCNLCRIDPSSCKNKILGGDGAVLAHCGDGKINRGEEECDDGNHANGDGCDKNCKIETTTPAETPTEKTETEETGKTITEETEILHPAGGEETEKPVTITPVISSPVTEILHPSSEPSGHLRTTDQTPLLSEKLQPETEYEIKIYNARNEEIKIENTDGSSQKLSFETNAEGKFIYEIPQDLNYGLYDFRIIGENENYSVQLEVIDTPYPEMTITKTADREIEGYAEKNAEIIIYLLGSSQTLQLTPDTNGYFSYTLPENENALYVLQVYNDRVISKNLTYVYPGKSKSKFWYYPIFVLTVALITEYKNKKFPKQKCTKK